VVHVDKLKKCYSQLPETEAVTADSTEVGTANEPSTIKTDFGNTLGARVHQRQRSIPPPQKFVD